MDKKLIFLHIPKAGGSTLHSVIRKNYPWTKIFNVDGWSVDRSIAKFKAMPQRKIDSFACVKGHMPFGLHDWFTGEATYITMVRDPVQRVISYYYFIQRSPLHHLYEPVVNGKMSLADYVDSGLHPELRNGQTWHLASTYGVYAPPEQLATRHLQRAKAHLKRYFAFVGTTRHFDLGLMVLRRIFNWQNVYYHRRNVSAKKPRRDAIAESVIRSIENNNALDIELVQFAEHLFERQVAAHGDSLLDDLARFERDNARYSRRVKPLVWGEDQLRLGYRRLRKAAWRAIK